MNKSNTRITIKHKGGAAKFIVEIFVNGKPAVVTSHCFTFAHCGMLDDNDTLNFDELKDVLDVVDAYKRSRVWA